MIGLVALGACSQPRDLGLGAPGTLQAVTLVTGSVFYGVLDRATGDAVVLRDVYYVQVGTDPQSNQRVNKLVRRSQSDWHGPEKMSVPFDKILLVESIGPQSTVAKFISETKAKPTP